MRIRNIKGASEIINNSDYVIDNYKSYKGSFNKVFNNNNKINIEIGMGKGNFIINMAINNPNINFIGIEKYDSIMVRALQKINKPISNLKLIRMDASEIDEVFYREIDTVYLNFSDPWPKDRHSNRRLTSILFLKKYENIFISNKKIIMKTDNRNLFEFSIISFNNYNYIIKEISLDLYNDKNLSFNVPTEYELKFHLKGYPIYRISVEKE